MLFVRYPLQIISFFKIVNDMAYFLAGELRTKAMKDRFSLIRDLKRSYSFLYHHRNWRYICKYASYSQLRELHKLYCE